MERRSKTIFGLVIGLLGILSIVFFCLSLYFDSDNKKLDAMLCELFINNE